VSKTLADLGERLIISELLAPRYGSNAPPYGDDCAQLMPPNRGGRIIVTTDPCPPPMALGLGFTDEYYRGWLLATINLSDLAAAGAEPLALLTSLQLPAAMEVSDFLRLLDGIDACCSEANTGVVGGNLKESASIDVAATAIGWCEGEPLSRRGAAVDDQVVLIGELGEFWAASLGIRAGLLVPDPEDPLLRNVLTPRPRLRAAAALREHGLLSACIDNSDGLYPALIQLAETNDAAIRLEHEAFHFSERVSHLAAALEVDPVRLALGWGDWQLVATCRSADTPRIAQFVAESGDELHILGRVVEGVGVRLRKRGREGLLIPLDSQRFRPDSWFSSGLDSYIEAMINQPLLRST
jgi:thiamine-monophosphate kinase